MTGSDTTGSDTTGSDTTGSDTTGSDTTGSDETETGTEAGEGTRARPTGGPQPLTVFTGSHGLQADKPRAGEDADEPDDTSTETADPDTRPDVRR